MTNREVMQQALECIERLNAHGWILADYETEVYAAITALREALAQPEQPVACRFCHSKKGCWAWQCYSCGEIDDVQQPPTAAQQEQEPTCPKCKAAVLYECVACSNNNYPPKPEQEPCIGKDPQCPCQDGDACHYKDCVGTKALPVAQPEQEPSPWRDMVVVTLVREGIDKHKARELADHFAAERNNG